MAWFILAGTVILFDFAYRIYRLSQPSKAKCQHTFTPLVVEHCSDDKVYKCKYQCIKCGHEVEISNS